MKKNFGLPKMNNKGFTKYLFFCWPYFNKVSNTGNSLSFKCFCIKTDTSINKEGESTKVIDKDKNIASEKNYKLTLIQKLKDESDLNTLDGLYNSNKNIFERDLELTMLFLDIYSSKVSESKTLNDEEITKNKLIMILISEVDKVLLTMDPFLILSFFETITKFKYFNNQLWMRFEYILIKTNFIHEIEIKYYHLLLKGFENFFSKESVIPTEEIFEFIENNFIIKMKTLIKEAKLYSAIDLKSLIENYIIFGKNLEGSRDLFDLLIKCIQEHKGFRHIKLEDLICIYFVSLLIESNVYKNKALSFFINSLETLINMNEVNLFENLFKKDSQLKYLFKWSVLKKQNKDLLVKLNMISKTDLDLI